MKYEDIYANLCENARSFSAGEFRASGVSPFPDKVLHDMVRRGYLQKTGWGEYRIKDAVEFFAEKRTSYEEAVNWLLEEFPLDFAFCGSDAVSIWTKGGYNTGGNRFIQPVNIAVRERDLYGWRLYLEGLGKPYTIEGMPNKESFAGAVFVLHPAKRLKIAEKDGMPVMPLEDTIKMCRDNPYVYEPALEMFDRMYGTKTGVKYGRYQA
jgi:hypothetical protein